MLKGGIVERVRESRQKGEKKIGKRRDRSYSNKTKKKNKVQSINNIMVT
jgi:hypothetical protein